MTTIHVVRERAKRATGNGTIQYGFIAATDKGLSEDQFTMVPHGSERRVYGRDEYLHGREGFEDDVTDCLISDAKVVSSIGVDNLLLPYVAATRAVIYAAGYLGEEHTVSPVEHDDGSANAVIATYPHVAKAAELGLQEASFGAYTTAVLFWTTGHNTGGHSLPRGYIKAITTFLQLDPNFDKAKITDAVYKAAHGTDKRITLRFILWKAAADALVDAQSFFPAIIPTQDAWAQLRTSPGKDGALTSANIGLIDVLIVLIKTALDYGFAGMKPMPNMMNDLCRALDEKKHAPHLFHNGAQYLFGKEKRTLILINNLKVHTGVLIGFCTHAGLQPSLTSAVHLQALGQAHGLAAWNSAGDTISKGQDMTPEMAKACLSAVGAAVADHVPDPVAHPDGYKKYSSKTVDNFASLFLS